MAKQKPTREALLALPGDAVLSPEEAACLSHLTVLSLARYRYDGGGPVYTRIGKMKIGYAKQDVLDWLKSRRFRDRGHEMDEAAKHAPA